MANKNFIVKNGLDVGGTITGVTTTQSSSDNSTKLASTAYVTTAVVDLIGGAPGSLDTLNELAAAINDDASYASTLTTALATKAPLALPQFTNRVGIGVAAHGTSGLNITNTNQHIRLNNGAELGVISLLSSGELDLWGHGDAESINFRTGTGSGTVVMNVVGSNVGIGNTSPQAKIHATIEGSVPTISSNTVAVFNRSGGASHEAYMSIIGGTGGACTIQFGDTSDEDAGRLEYRHDTNHMAFYTDATERMRITSAGNVGIAKTALATWSSGYNALQIGGKGFVGAHSSSDLYVGQNAYFNSGWKYEASVAASLTQHSGGKITQFVAAAGTAGNAITWNTAIDIHPDGDVLVGSSTNLNVLSGTPKLQIGSGTGHSSLQFYSGASSVAGLYFGDATSGGARYSGYIEYRHNSNSMAFRTNDAERMSIDSLGNVGIGVAANTARLKVEQSVSSEWAMNIKHSSSGVNYGLSIETSAGASNDVAALQIYTPSGGGLKFTNQSRLGIGTSAPGAYTGIQSNLEVKSSTHGGIAINAGTNSLGMLAFVAGGTHRWSIESENSATPFLAFNEAGTYRLAIDHGGNVGIGTTTPATSLDVGSKIDAIRLPNGTTAQRPTGALGQIRYNTTTSEYEVYKAGLWLSVKTDTGLRFQQGSTHFNNWTISADGQTASVGNTYSGITVNLNLEGDFVIITKWQHDYMSAGICYKAGITNANFTGESADSNGPYGGADNVNGFVSGVSGMYQYHFPNSTVGGGNYPLLYIRHKRSGNTISTAYSTNSASGTDPSHSSWTGVDSQTIASTDHCKPIWGEASGTQVIPLEILYVDITGAFNST